jgi:excisionase family DNA binding protein
VDLVEDAIDWQELYGRWQVPSDRKREPEFDSAKEFSDVLGVSINTTYRAISEGVVRASKVRGSWRIPRSERERLSRGTNALSQTE